MRIFITGSTGFIGSMVVQELINAGHEVLGLARSNESAKKLQSVGAQAHHGSLEDLESLRRGAANSDGVIHLAFINDFSNFRSSAQTDRRAIEALGAELAGSHRPMVVASGIAGLRMGNLLTEDYLPNGFLSALSPRKSEVTALNLISKGVNASVVRLSPSVHGDGDQGFSKWLIDIARKKGFSAYVGNGRNRWTAIHRLDAATLFRLAIEKGSSGAIYHAVADEGVPVHLIANLIGRRLNVPVISKSRLTSFSHFGRFFGMVVGMDCPASNKKTQDLLGWHPIQPSLLDDLEQCNYYFRT